MAEKKSIKRLQFTYVRGATNPDPVTFHFDPQKSIVLIFGENGSGKSTIADALDFICNNKFGSLDNRSGTTPDAHIVSTTGQSSDLQVELDYGGNIWKAKLQRRKPVTTPTNPPRAFVLRRADITSIMEAADGKRYDNLKEFITIPEIDRAEVSLRTACKTTIEEVNQLVSQRDTAEKTLQQTWEAEGKPHEHYLKWARIAIESPITDLKQRALLNKTLKTKLDEAIRSEKALSIAENKLQEALGEQNIVKQQLDMASQSQVNTDIVSTLKATQDYLHKHPEIDHCPICTKPESYNVLIENVSTQLSKLQNVQALYEELEKKGLAVNQAKGVQTVESQAWIMASTDLITLLPDAPSSLMENSSKLPPTLDVEAFRLFLHQLEMNRPNFEKNLEQDEKTIAQHTLLTAQLDTIDRLKNTIQTKEAVSQRLNAFLNRFEQERKQYVQETVDSISSEVSQLYARIHPNEAIGEPSFGLKPNTIGSLTMKGRFGADYDVPPVAYYSEAHLDTLGLCVYLALAKKSENALVVLDDVLMSVDDPHLARIIELINEEAPNFGHVIITTHSRAWFDSVRLGNKMSAQLIELYGWDLDGGIRHDHTPLGIDELRKAVKDSKIDRQLIASKAGILLEQLLDEITLRYNSRLPRKHPPKYTLGELADGIDKKLSPLLRLEYIDTEGKLEKEAKLFPLIQAATSDTWIRNQVGAHFNTDGAGIPDAMVAQFGENVLAVADALLCKHCQQIPRKNNSGSYLECGSKCGRTRLFPIIKV